MYELLFSQNQFYLHKTTIKTTNWLSCSDGDWPCQKILWSDVPLYCSCVKFLKHLAVRVTERYGKKTIPSSFFFLPLLLPSDNL